MLKFLVPAFTTLLIVLALLLPKSAQAAYSVSGQVIDNRTGNGIPGNANGNIYIYADNTSTGARAYPDGGGNWQLAVPDGPHSIEIANAGSFGWAPISPEKVTVNGTPGSVQTITFRIIMGGYDVVGRVVDQSGRGVPNVLIYSDFPSAESAVTDGSGNYRLRNLRYGGQGHIIYVRPDEGWVVGQDYQVVNPSSPQTEVNVNFTLTSPVRYTYPSPYSYPYPYPYPTPSYTYPTPYSYPTPSYTYPTPSYAYPTPYTYPTPGAATNATCTLSASSTFGNVPFTSRLTGIFFPNNSGARPSRYRFIVGGQPQDVLSENFSHTHDWHFNSSGSFATRLEIFHSAGGVTTCFGPTITSQSGAYTYPTPSYTYPSPGTSYTYPTPYSYPYPTPGYSYGQGTKPITSGFGALLALNPNTAQLLGEENARRETNSQTAWLGTAFEPIRQLFSQIFKI